jgi:hypothetical protein
MSSDIPRFHDGLVTGIRVTEKSATLFLRQTNDEEYALDLEGLEVLHMEDFQQSNIISHVEVVTLRAPDGDVAFDRLFGAPHPAAEPIYQEQYAATIELQQNRIESGETKLLIVVASWGADLLAICREVTCRRV